MDDSASASPVIVLAGGTGDLGARIAWALLERGAVVRALVRSKSDPGAVAALHRQGAQVVKVDFESTASLTSACDGAACVVSALSGLYGVVVEAQTRLLEAAVEAGVPRFIPSDFAIDFAKLPPGTNRNFDLRRQFAERLDAASVQATSVLNGAFMELLTGQAPIILFPLRRVLYWGAGPDQPLDFTTKNDTAAFTAAAALDPDTPRFLRIAGSQVTARELAQVMTDVSGRPYPVWRGGRLRTLRWIIKAVRVLFPATRRGLPGMAGNAVFAQHV